jgi:hypothetical protein
MAIITIQPTDTISASRSVINSNFSFLAGLSGVLVGSSSLNFPSIPSGESRDLTFAVTGAVAGRPLLLGAPAALEDGLTAFAWVSATSVVTVRLTNLKADGTEVNPAAGTYSVVIF